ncbi:MAG: helix-turn-helix domain-containing protein [Proteobacteria bacterium]|nr:helix-turn-helix domain-containing protein [Pseudomonadota bacterium]
MDKQEFLRDLGAYISKVRRERRISQQQLAGRSGKMLNTISNIERGLADPRASTLVSIAGALGIPAPELLIKNHNAVIKEVNSALMTEIVKLLHAFDDAELRTAHRVLSALRKQTSTGFADGKARVRP